MGKLKVGQSVKTVAETKEFLEQFDMGERIDYFTALDRAGKLTAGMMEDTPSAQKALMALGNYMTLHLHDSGNVLSQEEYNEFVDDLLRGIDDEENFTNSCLVSSFDEVFTDLANLMKYKEAKAEMDSEGRTVIKFPILHLEEGTDRYRIYASLHTARYVQYDGNQYSKIVTTDSVRLV